MTDHLGKNEQLLAAARAGRFTRDLELLETDLLPSTTVLVHFSRDARQIAKEGFRYGTADMDSLGLSYGAKSKEPGFNYAMLADDEFGLRTLCEYDFGADATSAVVFQSSCVKFGHYDEFVQSIFWGPDVSSPFVVLECPLDPMDEDDEERLEELAEPHNYPWDVLDQEGVVLSSHDNLFDALDAAAAHLKELASERTLGAY